jgi:LmbE family N-acetylglucosaminyl deacetylase
MLKVWGDIMMNKKVLEVFNNANTGMDTGSWLGCIKGNRVLIIAPHPDDEVIGCGGSILKYLSEGIKVTIIVVTNGEYGSTSPHEVDRQAECIAAWSNYKDLEIRFMGKVDSHIDSTIVKDFIDIVNDIQPDIIYVPWLMDRHIDHVVVNFYLKQALEELRVQCMLAFYEVLYPLYSNKTTNITKYFSDKIEILKNYKSQLMYLNLESTVKYQAKLRAALMRFKKVEYAEAFFVCNTETYKEIVQFTLNDNYMEVN